MIKLPPPTHPFEILRQAFGVVLLALIGLVGLRGVRNRSTMPEMLVAQGRLQSLSRRLHSLILRIATGTVRAARPGRLSRERKAEVAGAVPGGPGFPRGFGWMVRDNGPEGWRVRDGAGRVGLWLNDAETLAMLALAPCQAGRIVRPLCHALGMAAPEAFRPPPRARRKRRAGKARKGKAPRKVVPRGARRVASADWPKNVVGAGETVPVRSGRRAGRRRGSG